MDLQNTVLSLVVLFAAGLLQSLSGFGFCLLALPVLSIYLSTTTVVPLLVVLSIFGNIIVVYDARKHLELKTVWPLFPAGALFTIAGAWLLSTLDGTVLKIAIGAITVLAALLLSSGFEMRVKNEKLWMLPIGALSGLLGGSVSLNGPPVVIFFAATGKEKHSFRAKLAAYFLFLNLLTIPSHAYAGLLTVEVLKLCALASGPLCVGLLLGLLLSKKVSEKLFKKIVLCVITGTGLTAVVSALV